jgi:hypothetical protein
MIKLLMDYGADMDAATPRGWTPLSYARAKGKYGPTEEQGIYPEVGHGWAGWLAGGRRWMVHVVLVCPRPPAAWQGSRP